MTIDIKKMIDAVDSLDLVYGDCTDESADAISRVQTRLHKYFNELSDSLADMEWLIKMNEICRICGNHENSCCKCFDFDEFKIDVIL